MDLFVLFRSGYRIQNHPFSFFSGYYFQYIEKERVVGATKKDASEAVFDEIKAEVRITKDCNYE